MTFSVAQVEQLDAAVPARPRVRRLRAAPPALSDEPAMMTWALSIMAAAEQRVAELEAKLAYFEGLSTTDELTSALNRRGFLFEFSRAIDAARRGGPTGTVIVCDLDGFKPVNDRYGHAAGDEVLRHIAGLLSRRVRKMDAVGRLGGDEFAVLLIGADLPVAQQKCQMLARALANSPPHVKGRPVDLGASFGVASYDGSDNEEEVLHRADMAMYADKRRTEQADESPHRVWR